MRRRYALLTAVGVLTGAIVVGFAAFAANGADRATPAPARQLAARTANTLAAGQALRPGHALVSSNGRYRAYVGSTGRLAVRTRTGRLVWRSGPAGASASLYLSPGGQLAVQVRGQARWSAGTRGSGRADVLTLRNDGVLALTTGSALVWSDVIGNGCPARSGKVFLVDLSAQFARVCADGQQLRTSPVTSGASAYGDATPTGTWHVQAKIRNTVLYPAAGGAYPVKYWVPYDGAYGVHDSPWQRFAYGSSRYKTQGSHGCVHLPGPMMAWFYAWVRVGTTVTIHA